MVRRLPRLGGRKKMFKNFRLTRIQYQNGVANHGPLQCEIIERALGGTE
jgi:hypothetical protein